MIGRIDLVCCIITLRIQVQDGCTLYVSVATISHMRIKTNPFFCYVPATLGEPVHLKEQFKEKIIQILGFEEKRKEKNDIMKSPPWQSKLTSNPRHLQSGRPEVS